MYQLIFYVPESHLEAVKAAVFESGAGRIGHYEHCSWECLGTGQFRPLDGSNPYVGESGTEQRVTEYRVEMVCSNDFIKAAVAALIASHPYETPAYSAVQLSIP